VADERPVAVFGPNRLTADIIDNIVGDVGGAGRLVAVLIDPDPEHWAAARDRAVITVLSEPHPRDVVAAVRRGADAVVDANAVLTDLARVVAIVRAGGAALTPMQARLVVDALRADSERDRITLTPRENDIIASVIAGDSVKQTALRLGIAPKTVENLQRRLFRKLDVRNRAQAVSRVHELGLLPPDASGSSGMGGDASPGAGGVNP
jgi:DNA-binding NarL/FixJ family response regulator